MSEINFNPLREELQRRQEAKKPQPLTREEHELDNTVPMTVRDYWLSLRRSIEEKSTSSPVEELSVEEIKRFSVLVTPELITSYKSIFKQFQASTVKSDTHPEREFIDLHDINLSNEIEQWIHDLVVHVRGVRGEDFSVEDKEELEAQCWLFFDAVGNVMNTKSIERDINDFDSSRGIKTISGEKKEETRKKLLTELATRYPLDKAELNILIDLVQKNPQEGEEYSPRLLVETIARLWQEYHLGDRKKEIAKISLGYMLAEGVESFMPSLFEDIIADNKFNVTVFLEYYGLGKCAEVVETGMQVELEKVMTEISYEINARIAQSLFYREFEFMHEQSLGEVFEALERGKNATEQLLQSVISRFAPTLAGIAMSLGFLTKINPILGAIGTASLPVMYVIARKQNKTMMPLYTEERGEEAANTTRLASMTHGWEEIRTSPHVGAAAKRIEKDLNTIDTLSLHRSKKQAWMFLKRRIPFDISTVVAAGVGGVLQQAGVIQPGAVLSNMAYADRLNYPVTNLINLYFDSFARYIQDIQHMESVLGRYEELDLPEGEKEQSRTPVSNLPNMDISLKDVSYKKILKGVNLEVKQGEFVTIAGASGIGKSTLLRNIVGLYKPNAGEITIGGVAQDQIKKYGDESIYSVMAYCNQNPQLFDGMTLRENLLLWSQAEVSDEKICEVLRDLHLDKFIGGLDKEISHVSGGERVRIGLARTLLKNAKIILLDEPTASLDSQAATEVRSLIKAIHSSDSSRTIICVSHDVEMLNVGERKLQMMDLNT